MEVIQDDYLKEICSPGSYGRMQLDRQLDGNGGGTGYSGASIRGAAPANLAIPVPWLFWRLLLVSHLFHCSSIDWTTVFCIDLV